MARDSAAIRRKPGQSAEKSHRLLMVTAGGVRLDEVNPDTMESRIHPRLFLAGEVLDLTGPSGGYNLQLAFSTGFLAGIHIADAAMS